LNFAGTDAETYERNDRSGIGERRARPMYRHTASRNPRPGDSKMLLIPGSDDDGGGGLAERDASDLGHVLDVLFPGSPVALRHPLRVLVSGRLSRLPSVVGFAKPNPPLR